VLKCGTPSQLLTPHTSHLTPHASHLTPHTSHLTPHTSHLTQPRRPAAPHSWPTAGDKWTPSTSTVVKQEAITGSSNRFSFSLETLSLPQIIAEEDPLLRESHEKIDSVQIGSDGADKVKKQLAGAIRDSFSGLSRNSIRFAIIIHTQSTLHDPRFVVFAIFSLTRVAEMLIPRMLSAMSCQKFQIHRPPGPCNRLKHPVASAKLLHHNHRSQLQLAC
jgi:hypothetical protein